MITVHHLNNSRSQRILWLLEELGLDYKIEKYQRDPVTMLAPQELLKIHPLGKSPLITDGGVTLAESGAIIEYLLNTYGEGKLRPTLDSADARRFTYFLHYAEGSLMPPLLMSLVFSRLSKPPVPFFIRPIAKVIELGIRKKYLDPELKKHFDFLELELSNREWFAGSQFSAADIQMSFPIEAGASRVGFKNRPHLQKFFDRIHSRDSYQKALQRGGEYAI